MPQIVVENLRKGMSPEEACLKTLEWIADHTKLPRLLYDDGRPNFNVTFYALDKKGRHGCAAIWGGRRYTVHDGSKSKTFEGAYLYAEIS